MIRTPFRKIFRDIASRKGRTALVAISIFVGVLGVVTLTSVSEIMIDKLQHDLKEDEIAMLSLWVEPEDENTPVNHQEAIETIAGYPELTAVEGWKTGRFFWKTPGEDGFIESNIRGASVPYGALKIEPVRLVEGSYPVAGQNQVAIERRMAERYDLEIGDEVVVRILSNLDTSTLLNTKSLSEIPEETWTISGIVFHPYSFTGASNVYAAETDVTHISGVEDYGRLVTRFTDFEDAEQAEDSFEAWVEAETPYKVNFTFLENPADSEFISVMRQWTDTLTILALVSMLVASFLVVTVINTILVEQKKQIGVMKSIGATQPDNFKIYSGVALAYGIIGTIPGLLLGIPAGYMLTQVVAPLINILIEDFTIAPTAIVIGAVMGLGVPVIASSLPVYLGTRVSILSAMTDLGLSSNYGGGFVARTINRLPFSPSVRQALANIVQKRGRLALTGFTLTLAVGAFMGVTAVFLSLNSVIRGIHDTFNFEIAFDPDEKQDYEAVATFIQENMSEVAAVTASYDRPLTVLNVPPDSIDVTDTDEVNEHSSTIFVDGFDMTGSALQLDLSSGEGWENDPTRTGIVLLKPTAESLDKEVGDTLIIVQDGKVHELEVLGIADLPFEELFGFMRWQDVAAIVDPEDKNRPVSFLIQLKDENVTAAEVDKIIGDLRELLLANGITANFDNQVAFQEEDNNLILTAGLIFNIASLVMASIGAIGLLVSLSISVFERQREIGVMRSVGAGTGTIISQFLTEGLLVGVIAWLIGVPLSYGISLLFKDALPIDFDFRYPLISLVLGLVGLLVIAFVASIWPSVSASRRTVSDILRYQ